jgi:hypothetical protein
MDPPEFVVDTPIPRIDNWISWMARYHRTTLFRKYMSAEHRSLFDQRYEREMELRGLNPLWAVDTDNELYAKNCNGCNK